MTATATTQAAAPTTVDLSGPKGPITTYTPPADALGPTGTEAPAPAEGASGATGATAAAETPAEGKETPPAAAAADETKLERAKRVAAAAKRQGARNRELMAGRAAAEQRAAETSRQLEQERQGRVQVEAIQARLRDPNPAVRLAAARELGLQPADIVKDAIADGSPDAEVKRALARVQELEQRLRSEEQARVHRQNEANAKGAQAAFVKEVGNAELYPILSTQPPAVVLSAARDVIEKVKQERGADALAKLSNADIAEFLEWQYSSHAKAKSTSSAVPKASTEAAQASGSTAPKTLTNGHAAATHSGPLKRDDMTEVQKRAADVALLEKLAREAAKAG